MNGANEREKPPSQKPTTAVVSAKQSIKHQLHTTHHNTCGSCWLETARQFSHEMWGEGGSWVWCMRAPCFNLSFENSDLNCSLHREFEISTLHSKFFEILMFVFLSKDAHKSFCVKFSGLMNKRKILEKSYWRPRIFNVQTYIWSLFKARKNYGAPMKPFELFCFQHSKYFEALLYFLVACNKKFQRANAQPYAYAANTNVNNARWTRDSQACTRLVDSLFCITRSCSCFFSPGFSVLYHVFARKQYAFSVLHYAVSVPYTVLYVTSILDFFCPWDNRALLY